MGDLVRVVGRGASDASATGSGAADSGVEFGAEEGFSEEGGC